jgi:arylsulfatase A-like enzyme
LNKRYIDELSGRGPYQIDEGAARPNLFLISVDMIPLEFYQQFDNFPTLQTPHLDSMRQDGVFFSNCFSTSPLCTPSRASYLTGRYSYITTNSERSHDGHVIHLRDSDIFFPEYLKSSGYTVRHVGKSHVGTHKFIDTFGENDAPWDRWSPPWFDDDDYLVYLHSFGLQRFEFDEEIVGVDPSGEGPGNHYGGWIARQDGKEFPVEATYPFFLVEKAMQKIRSSEKGQPLYLQLDFFGPHQPFAIPHGLEERRAELEAQVSVPESFQRLMDAGLPFDSQDGPDYSEPRIYGMYRKNWGLKDPETVKKYIIANILQFELIDMAIGRLFDFLKAQELYDESWMFFIGDHGEMNCESGLIDKGAYLNPRVIRVPFITKPAASWDGDGIFIGKGTSVDNQPVSLLDLAPSVLGLAGISHAERQDGTDLIETVLKDQPRPDTPILCEIWSHVMPNPAVGMVFKASDDQIYMFTYNCSDPVDELYLIDCSKYPANLFSNLQYAEIVKDAVLKMDAVFATDTRWRSYLNFIRLEYAELLGVTGVDRQHFSK